MKEYKFNEMIDELEVKLTELGYTLIEEEFVHTQTDGGHTWVLYTDDDIRDIISEYTDKYIIKEVASTGWESLWMNYLKDGWLTKETYYFFEKKIFDDDRKTILINPALAFGTGSHSTTQLAAHFVEKLSKDGIVLDVGTGSGILSILASLWGATEVYAFDNDAVAVENARENIQLNGVSNVFAWAGCIDEIDESVAPDLVVANIISSVLQEIHPSVINLKPKYIVYSGILMVEYNDFIDSINLDDYSVAETKDQLEWRSVLLERN